MSSDLVPKYDDQKEGGAVAETSDVRTRLFPMWHW